MATVPDLSGNTPTDNKLAAPNRLINGSPIGAILPAYPGERVLDIVNGNAWRSVGPTNSEWILDNG